MAKSNKELLKAQPEHLSPKERLGYKLMELVPDGGTYTSAQRIEALNIYVACGSLRETSKQTAIPRQTLTDWTQTHWWDKALDLVLETRHRKLEARWLGVQERALGLLEKAMTEGEEVLGKDGQKHRVEVGAYVAAKVAALAQDKRGVLVDKRQEPEQQTKQLEGIDKLVALADAFARVAVSTKQGEGHRIIDITIDPTDDEEDEDGKEPG